MVKYLHGIKLIESDFGLYLYDAHGNVTEILDSNYEIALNYTYDPFGDSIISVAESIIRDDEMQSLIPGAGIMSGGMIINHVPENPYRYCGEYTDIETGYVYLRARYYDPTLGRFISEDSAKDGYNWYVYCGNDPVNRVDPSGEFAVTALLIAIGVGAVIGAGFNMGSQLISNGFDFSKLDYTSILASGAAGAVSGALGFFTAGICSSTLLGAMAVGAASNTAEYLAYNLVAGNDITWGGVATAAASGAISGAIGYGIGSISNRIASNKANSEYSDDFLEWLNKGDADNKVYFGVSENGTYDYVGISKQPLKTRLVQHRHNGKAFFDLDLQHSGLTRNQARALEQYYIENGPNALNKINSISLDSVFYNDAIK